MAINTRTIAARLLFIFTCLLSHSSFSEEPDLSFDDFPLMEPLSHPHWFKKSFLDLQEDLQESLDNRKKGIIVYFGQKRCPYCQMLMEVNFGQKVIVIGAANSAVDVALETYRKGAEVTMVVREPEINSRVKY